MKFGWQIVMGTYYNWILHVEQHLGVLVAGVGGGGIFYFYF
jgi:hypothetical protein